ncbi:hypothetical protein [uncultured Clostridium sp.]|uniref:hypothetical protein n=1 Tax=uncultured Clostridium sp. TaxID=59620 RepID=UPI0026107B25|nr:hypothetical protein [uncultured Clostridium sp.]
MKKELLVKEKPKYTSIILFACFVGIFIFSTIKAVRLDTFKDDFFMFIISAIALVILSLGMKHQIDENKKAKNGGVLIDIKNEGISYLNDISGKIEFARWSDILDVMYRPRSGEVTEVFGIVIKMNKRIAGDIIMLENLEKKSKKEALMVRVSLVNASYKPKEIVKVIQENISK